MGLTFVDELPEGTISRRTKSSGVLEEVIANQGKWALVKNYDGVAAEKVSRKAGEVRAALKELANKADDTTLIQYDVRLPAPGQVQGFLRAPLPGEQESEDFPSNA